MPRIFHPIADLTQVLRITGEKAHYLSGVLRCAVGDDIVVFDGRGASYKAIIKSITNKEVLAVIVGAVHENMESPLSIVLLQGLLKGEKMDLVVQKTTELGVKEIVPLITDRSQLRGTRKAARWARIAEEAARQCGRSFVPVVHDPVQIGAFLQSLAVDADRIKGLMFWEAGGLPLKQAAEKISSSFGPQSVDVPLYLLVGPEGGFTKEEVRAAESQGFVIASLGNRILRTETAAIATTAIIQFFMGDLG